MRRISYTPYLFLVAALFALMNLPSGLTTKMRAAAVSSLAPSWQALSTAAPLGQDLLELERLRQENQSLRMQIDHIRQWLLLEDRLEEQWERLQSLAGREESSVFWKDFFKRRTKELVQTLDLQLQSLPAKVIFREPASWSSCVWINIGEKDNRSLCRTIVAKNSPVLIGASIVGVIEEVGERKSRVRLLTDASLVPSVRAIRGSQQNLVLLEHVNALLFSLSLRDDLFASEGEAKQLSEELFALSKRLLADEGDHYLAKGELYGSSSPIWRSHRQILKGVGFNYDYPDSEGPARDLRTGVPLEGGNPRERVPLLQVGDLLVTTGLDGIFPPGLRVATVSKVAQLREGGAAYEIEARATAGNLDELTHVLVLPALN